MSSSTFRNRPSQTLRALQAFIDENPKIDTELDHIKNAIAFAETRLAQLLEDKEEVIFDLQTKLFKAERAAKNNAEELSETKAAAQAGLQAEIQLLQKSLAASNPQKEHFANDLKKQSASLMNELKLKGKAKTKFDEELKELKGKLDAVNAKMQILKEENEFTKDIIGFLETENAYLERREKLLVNDISSLRNEKLKLQNELNDASSAQERPSKKQKVASMEEEQSMSADSESDGEPKIKKEYESNITSKVKHWAPAGYHHVKEVSCILFFHISSVNRNLLTDPGSISARTQSERTRKDWSKK